MNRAATPSPRAEAPAEGPWVLIVDDDPDIRALLQSILLKEGYKVCAVDRAAAALSALESRPFEAAVVDQVLNGEDGLELMDRLQSVDAQLPVIIFTGYGSIDGAVSAVRRGAYSYLTKPIDGLALLQSLSQAVERRGLTRELVSLKMAMGSGRSSLERPILGRSPAMQAVYQAVVKVAPTRGTVAIYGESGTGKELIARLIHAQSPRAGQPFVVVNCGAVPDSLVESELFGHLRGAFSGASSDHAGLFRAATGGTLFLDELSEASPAFQVALLRVLQEEEVRPVGATQTLKVDVRVIVASQRNLRALVQAGQFREDLFYRVHILPIALPPLRSRGEDILLLAEHFLRRYAREAGREIIGFHPTTLDALMEERWQGNVRQLENRIKRAVVLCERLVIYPDDLANRDDSFEPRTAHGGGEPSSHNLELQPLRQAKEAFERQYLQQLLHEARGELARAAALAGKSQRELVNLLRKHRLALPDSSL